ncbi:MAG: phosphodiester glycosidase family protein [Candidatus Neomarinimicrobiota bacterium]
MKINQFLGITLLGIGLLSAETQFYTTSTTIVGPGVVHKKVHAPLVPWIINVLEVDLTNPYLKMESVKASDRLASYETTSSMSSRKSSIGHRVVGAVNADFYGTGGVPIGTQILNGEILKTSTGWSSIGFDISNRPAIATVTFCGNAWSGSSQHVINNVNVVRNADNLIVYNAYFGGNTNTNEWGTEVGFTAIDPWLANDTIRCRIEQLQAGVGSMALSKSRPVLSGHGTAAAFLNSLTIGDTIKIYLGINPTLPKLAQLVGGNLKILADGNYTGSTNTDRHPRTFAGISADSSRLYLAVVDGRQDGSIGMTYRDLANYMVSLGAEDAVNLDGGGSSTLVVHDVIENSLFEPERAVSNGLMVVSSAPETELVTIQVQPDDFRIFLGQSMKITASGWDQYYNPRTIDPAEVTFTVDPAWGNFGANGIFTATNVPGGGYLIIQYQDIVDTAYLYIKKLKSINLAPEFQITDNITPLQFGVTVLDEDNIPQAVPLTDFTWEVLSPEIGYFDENSQFHGIVEGSTRIVATFLDQTDTVTVKIEIGLGEIILDSLETLDGWDLDGVLYDPTGTSLEIVNSPKTQGDGAFQLNYQFIRSDLGRSWNYLQTLQPIYGIPDSLYFDFKSNPENTKTHMVVIVVCDVKGDLFQTSIITPDTSFSTYGLAMGNFGPVVPNTSLCYPISLKELQIRLGYYGTVGDTNRGTIYIDNLRIKYPSFSNVSIGGSVVLPRTFDLYQNWPNPFNATTTIAFNLTSRGPVRLTIFDQLGRMVMQYQESITNSGSGRYTWDGRNSQGQPVGSGVYLYRLEAGGASQVRKMLLLK